ncbi:hypothetical protein ORJ04_03590 [Rheinheimera baltica]|uniref:Uncharacterized protein n=1 Tax=Rheinheimera baltica TaxID=67576 RepID=A0ABT9HW20_9GAMM|nr:hypothetical protein [Rheinheimera baltica]MDP5135030.1 hypothetical protein [Rheinheimera baltica]
MSNAINTSTDWQKKLKNISSQGLATHVALDFFMARLELKDKFLYPPKHLFSHNIFRTGLHGLSYIKLTQAAGISAMAGIGYNWLDIKEKGFTIENSVMLTGNMLFLAESIALSTGMFFANNHSTFHKMSMWGARFGATADGVKAINYLYKKDYEKAIMYGALSAGNLGMALFANHHKGFGQRMLWQGFKRLPPHYFLLGGLSLWVHNSITSVLKD